MAERLAGQLAGGVGRDGGENGIALAEGNLGVHPVNGRGRGHGKLAHAVAPGGFQQVDGPLGIHAQVERGLVQTGADPGAGGQMDDLIELHGTEQLVHGPDIGEIGVDELERTAQLLQFLEIAAFDEGVVEIIQVVHRPDPVAFEQQPFANVGADEAGATGDEKVHAFTLTIRLRSVERGRGLDVRCWMFPISTPWLCPLQLLSCRA